jgi:hypothetical protein
VDPRARRAAAVDRLASRGTRASDVFECSSRVWRLARHGRGGRLQPATARTATPRWAERTGWPVRPAEVNGRQLGRGWASVTGDIKLTRPDRAHTIPPLWSLEAWAKGGSSPVPRPQVPWTLPKSAKGAWDREDLPPVLALQRVLSLSMRACALIAHGDGQPNADPQWSEYAQ